jgi:hypothetical protein
VSDFLPVALTPLIEVDVVGGTRTDPGDTELDDAIEIIVGDYIPDSLLRVQLAKRILAEVLRRTPITDPYARPASPTGMDAG